MEIATEKLEGLDGLNCTSPMMSYALSLSRPAIMHIGFERAIWLICEPLLFPGGGGQLEHILAVSGRCYVDFHELLESFHATQCASAKEKVLDEVMPDPGKGGVSR